MADKTYTVQVKTTATWYQEYTVTAEDEFQAKEYAEEAADLNSYTVGTAQEFKTKSVEWHETPTVVVEDDVYEPSEGVEHYGMFSDEGNLAVAAALAAALSDPTTTSVQTVQTIQEAVIAQGFPEADDTVVREAIAAELASWLLQQEENNA